MSNFRQILKSPILLFTGSRYMSYGLQFFRGILVAKYLGPYLFGVWGFLTLAQQYLSYTNFGLQYATTVKLATDSMHNREKRGEIIGVALTTTGLISACLILLGALIQILGVQIFGKYSFNQYAVILTAITATTHLQQVLINAYRVYGKLIRVAATELFMATSLLLMTLLFRGDELIVALLSAWAASGVICTAFLLIRAPFRLSLSLSLKSVRQLLLIGIPLLIYNVSFYLILISGRTVLSIFYSVEIMGFFSLANSITNATLLGFKAVSWVVFPDILIKTDRSVSNGVAAGVVKKVNDLYGTAVFLTVFAVILALPLLFRLLPQYRPAEGTLAILLLSQAVLSTCFGYNALAIARKRQLRVASISLIATVVVTGISLSISFLEMPFVWVAVAVLAGSLVFSFLQARLGSRIIGTGQNQSRVLESILPKGNLVALLFFLIGGLSGHTISIGLIGLGVFFVANRKKLHLLQDFTFEKFGAA